MKPEEMEEFYAKLKHEMEHGSEESVKRLTADMTKRLENVEWTMEHIELLQKWNRSHQELQEKYNGQFKTIKDVSRHAYETGQRRNHFKRYE